MVAAGMALAAVLGDSVREAEDAARTQAKLGQVIADGVWAAHCGGQAYGEALGEKLALDNDESRMCKCAWVRMASWRRLPTRKTG